MNVTKKSSKRNYLVNGRMTLNWILHLPLEVHLIIEGKPVADWLNVDILKQRAVVSVGSYHGRRSLVITGSGQREAGGSRDIRSGDGAGSALHSCELYDRWELVSYSGVVVYDGSMFEESLLFMMVQCLWIVLMTLIH